MPRKLRGCAYSPTERRAAIPGPAGAGAVLIDASGTVVARLGRYLGRQTNNVAEYQGLLLGLQHARDWAIARWKCARTPSCSSGSSRASTPCATHGLKPLHAEALRLLRAFDEVDLKHVPREENALADEMSNRAIDEEMR